MATIAELRVELFDVAPELETNDATKLARIDRWLNRAIDNIADDCYSNESQYNEAVSTWTAWKLTATDPTVTPSVNATKIKVGRLETTFGNGASTDNKYKSLFDSIPCQTIPITTGGC